MRIAPRVELSAEARAWLEKVSRSRVEAVRRSERARIVLMAADGKTNREIGRRLGITEENAARWRGRLEGAGPDRPRAGCTGPGAQADLPTGDRLDGGVPDDPPEARGGDALEPPVDGRRDRSECFDHRPHLVPAWAQSPICAALSKSPRIRTLPRAERSETAAPTFSK